MTQILIVYGSTHGHTGKIARAMAETLRAGGAIVDVAPAARPDPDPAAYDGIVVAASVHGGRFQRAVRRWVRRHHEVLNAKPTAFVSVCLGVLQRTPDVDRAIRAIVGGFLGETGWQPTRARTVAGAVLYTQYNWIIRFVMKRIVRKAGGGTDTSRDYDYTDWADLYLFTREFAQLVGPVRVAFDLKAAG